MDSDPTIAQRWRRRQILRDFRRLTSAEFADRHGNTRVEWQGTDDGVPGSDRPWRAGDRFDLLTPDGQHLISGGIDAEFAVDLNTAFRWTATA